ncbi:hypothetical protein BVRB_6g134830 isoform A [Beta vulgaris subsp. vulgaris]|uniref:uncharacterized protein LOC104895648 isoform X2 n=1 Tax=Beta vulgaris subsp. vulgaris TaxID=3555 RepID=UPI00053FE058|nr:uncharacterized protein LOC104895648 isoform X2 [Beta vulgaris subsp. vulgaris]KMT08757.1 hypothetical protein BVRB_6g134830 isoform A [Beta vulgaris subsp. vulgaris]
MEGLKKLEEIQRMLLFMESEGFISGSFSFTSSHSDSHRFLAQFLLFLMEPSGKLSIHNKCTLISQHLPKISPRFLEKALVVLPGEQTGILDDSLSVDLNREDANGGCHGLGTNYASADVALIGLDAMQRANSTLEDFCRSYFMFHGMDVKSPASIFKYLPMLSFTESFIYQLDTLNEKMVNVTMNKVIIRDGRSNEEAYTTLACSFNKDFESDPFRPLTLLLQYHGLLTERIREELKYGEEYWDLERRLCGASEQISIEDVMRAIHLKSFDYRVLNLLLYQLRGEEVDDLHMEFLTVSEFLVEISDDLFDYEEDVLENNFNVLRMFIRIYGPSAAPTMLAKYITEAEEKYEKLSQALDPQICLSYQKRCEEATREGGKISGYSLGSWSIPPLIVDEELYRSSMQNSP